MMPPKQIVTPPATQMNGLEIETPWARQSQTDGEHEVCGVIGLNEADIGDAMSE